jgi:hypothetical protein
VKEQDFEQGGTVDCGQVAGSDAAGDEAIELEEEVSTKPGTPAFSPPCYWQQGGG